MCLHLAGCPVGGVLEDGGEVKAVGYECSVVLCGSGAYGTGAAAWSAIDCRVVVPQEKKDI